MKQEVCKQFKKDFESSQKRTDAWVDEDVHAPERRILMTRWVGEAWSKLQRHDAETNFLSQIFKRMGYCNDMHGRENSLVKVRKVFDYTPPKKHAPKSKPLTKAQIKKRSVKLAAFLRKRRI